MLLSSFSPPHRRPATGAACTNDGDRYSNSPNCDDTANFITDLTCHMGKTGTADDNACRNTFNSDDIKKYFVKDNNAINCTDITYGCDVYEGAGLHMCESSKNIIVVDEGPTNETETNIVVDQTYKFDFSSSSSSNDLDPENDCCACLDLPFVYSMRLTDINEDGMMDVTFWTTGSRLRIFEMTDWSDGTYKTSSYSGASSSEGYHLSDTLRPVFTKNEGADNAQSKYTLSTTAQYCNMYDSNTGGGLAWIDYVRSVRSAVSSSARLELQCQLYHSLMKYHFKFSRASCSNGMHTRM